MFFDGINSNWTAFCFSHHANESSFCEHHFGKSVHAGSSCWTSRTNSFTFDRVNWTNVVNHTVGEVNGQLFTFGQHGLYAFMRSITTC